MARVYEQRLCRFNLNDMNNTTLSLSRDLPRVLR